MLFYLREQLLAAVMSSFCVDSMVRGYHIYHDIRSTSLNEELVCTREPDNFPDPFAMAVVFFEVIVGHIPRKISSVCMRCFFDTEAPSSAKSLVVGTTQRTRSFVHTNLPKRS